jgi:deoxyuridine 5'-triphosphate nucleotidohydrolase
MTSLRTVIGLLLEWFLSYDHLVIVETEDGAKIPFRKYDGDAGYDLFAHRDVGIPPGGTADVPSGIRVDPRSRIWLEIKARSSTLKSRGLEVVDAVIDKDYRGEMLSIVHNPTGENKHILAGERLVQVVPHRLIPLKFKRGKLSESPRGDRGFGSTGRS